MIVLGIVLVVLGYFLPTLVPIPPAIDTLLIDGGWLLVVIGVILLVLSYLGHPVGRGIGPARGGRRFWY